MNPTALIQRMALDGLEVSVTPNRDMKVKGPEALVTKWLPDLKVRKTAIICALLNAPPDVQDFIYETDERAAFLIHCAHDVYKTREAALAKAYEEIRAKWLNLDSRSTDAS